jgi:(aminoalkyl)phosphonate N-acetyltransferase
MLNIRKAEKPDCSEVYRLICELEETQFDYAAFEAVYCRNLAVSSYHYLLAELDGQAVGFGSLLVKEPLHHACFVGEIIELVVERQHTGKRIGSQLLCALKEAAKGNGCKSIEVMSKMRRVDAHRFYERDGFDKNWYGLSKQL